MKNSIDSGICLDFVTKSYYHYISCIFFHIYFRIEFKNSNEIVPILKKSNSNKSGGVGEEDLPSIVTEGRDFRNEIPDRLYLDSDPEFHLNINIVLSYLMLFHVDSHVIMVLRRVIAIYITWMISGTGFFIYMKYYPLLLEEPILDVQFSLAGEYLYRRLVRCLMAVFGTLTPSIRSMAKTLFSQRAFPSI